MKFLSHLDLARALDRAVRRAKLPVAYSAGFHPHAEISFGPPLPLGLEGQREPACLELARVEPVAEMTRALSRQLPRGLDLVSLELSDRGRRSPLADLAWAGWEFTLGEPPGGAACEPASAGEVSGPSRVERAVREFLAAPEWLVTRETKSKIAGVDIRPGVAELVFHPSESLLRAELSLQLDTLVKPEELLCVLTGLSASDLSVERQVRTYLRGA
jgi:radical SAM-linked protein